MYRRAIEGTNMRNYREAARLIREAAELLDERGKTMAISKRGAGKPFPITKEEIDAINDALHEWTVKEMKRIAPIWERDSKDPRLEELGYDVYAASPNIWIDNGHISVELIWDDYGYDNAEEGEDSGLEIRGEISIPVPDPDEDASLNWITLGWVFETLYYNGNYSLDYIPYYWPDIVEQLEELGYEEPA